MPGKNPGITNSRHSAEPSDCFGNQELSSQRVINENVIAMLKRFKIISDRYRNRGKRVGLRFNLITTIYNLELIQQVLKEVYYCSLSWVVFEGWQARKISALT